MGDIQKQTGMSWIEVQFLAKAVETLRDCRTTLMYTYVFAYYLAKNSEVSRRIPHPIPLPLTHTTTLPPHHPPPAPVLVLSPFLFLVLFLFLLEWAFRR